MRENNLTENKGLITAFAIVIFLFTFLYPPFITTDLFDSLKIYRLIFEGLVLLGLSVYSLKYGVKQHLLVAIVLCFYAISYAINTDGLDKVFSHFGKFALLVFMTKVFASHDLMRKKIKQFWIIFSCYLAIASVIGWFLLISKSITPWSFPERLYNYDYQLIPGIGNYLFKNAKGFFIPRYTGYFVEPIMMGFHFGFNILISTRLFACPKHSNWFKCLNIMGGVLTLSFAFYIFLIVYFLITLFARLSRKVLVFTLFPLITILYFSFINLDSFFKYSSIGDRLTQYLIALIFLGYTPFRSQLFGSGVIFFQSSIIGGASSGFIDLFAARGGVLFFIWMGYLYLNLRKIPGLYLYMMFYTLLLSYWHFPFFILGFALVGALECNKEPLIKNC